jgi:hypothetical protein
MFAPTPRVSPSSRIISGRTMEKLAKAPKPKNRLKKQIDRTIHE